MKLTEERKKYAKKATWLVKKFGYKKSSDDNNKKTDKYMREIAAVCEPG